MSTTDIDKDGVPMWDTTGIENKVEEFIKYFDPKLLDSPRQTPVLEFVEEMNRRFNVHRDYSKDLGHTKHGSKILGRTHLKPRAIFVDASIANTDRFPFVLAHEIGHIVLHRRIRLKQETYSDQEIVDSDHDLVTGQKINRTARDWIEWQANRFASALLLPRNTLHKAVADAQRERGIHRNVGRIFLESKSYSERDFRAIITKLQLVYGVNHTNIEYRLLDLGILIDRRGIDSNHISELLKTD